ncbi:MAG: hypothetical protein FJ138_08560 [Deltaproteobacteria bacterium]|nr:hypothetical protein [Deltaproteobacteria bacterium]
MGSHVRALALAARLVGPLGLLGCLGCLGCLERDGAGGRGGAAEGGAAEGGAAEGGAPAPAPVSPLSAEELLNPAACAGCHPYHFERWAASMHAYAARDPVFRAMNAKGQRETGGALGDLCVRCHAPLAVELGLTRDGLNLDEVPEHLQGVTCAFCHQVEEVAGAHNNPLLWANDGVLRGAVRDPAPGSPHAAAYSPLLDRRDPSSAALCGACHDVVTPAGVHLERTYLEWRQSLFSVEGALTLTTCGDCHMPVDRSAEARAALARGVSPPERDLHDHLMPGVDVALVDFPGRAVMEEAVRAELRHLLLPELCAEVGAGGGAEVELYLENVAAGHRVPSGAALDRRLWAELVAYDAEGARLFESGVVPPGEAAAAGLAADPQRWLLRDVGYRVEDPALATPADETHDFWAVLSLARHSLPGPQRPAALALAPPEDTHVLRRYRFGTARPVARIELRVWLRPMDLDVLAPLVASGDLDPAVAAAAPTFELEGARRSWTPERAARKVTRTGRELLCAPPF